MGDSVHAYREYTRVAEDNLVVAVSRGVAVVGGYYIRVEIVADSGDSLDKLIDNFLSSRAVIIGRAFVF